MKNTSKVYLENMNLLYAMNRGLIKDVKVRITREIFFVMALQNSNHGIIFSKIGDFQIGETLFEI
jgi:hypothetical protein